MLLLLLTCALEAVVNFVSTVRFDRMWVVQRPDVLLLSKYTTIISQEISVYSSTVQPEVVTLAILPIGIITGPECFSICKPQFAVVRRLGFVLLLIALVSVR